MGLSPGWDGEKIVIFYISERDHLLGSIQVSLQVWLLFYLARLPPVVRMSWPLVLSIPLSLLQQDSQQKQWKGGRVQLSSMYARRLSWRKVYIMWQDRSVQATACSVHQQCVVCSISEQCTAAVWNEQCVTVVGSVQQQRAECRSSVQCAVCSSSSM